MKQLYANLWQSKRYASGILNSHAYLLRRERGNILFYNTGDAEDLDQIATLGGIDYQLLTHRDEVGSSLQTIQQRFNPQLGLSAIEAPYAAAITPVDLTFTEADDRVDDVRILHTPGHTDGSVCYFYAPPDETSYLFTGDTFFLSNGDWSTFVLNSAGGSEASLLSSLISLKELQPDVVLSSGFVGEHAYRELQPGQWQQAVQSAISKLQQ